MTGRRRPLHLWVCVRVFACAHTSIRERLFARVLTKDQPPAKRNVETCDEIPLRVYVRACTCAYICTYEPWETYIYNTYTCACVFECLSGYRKRRMISKRSSACSFHTLLHPATENIHTWEQGRVKFALQCVSMYRNHFFSFEKLIIFWRQIVSAELI